ncbi:MULTISPECIES: GyrI-like domain-containing protein [unclassified Tenacibaculum]|uniref:AraC family transcriptional regulator n=1 Tax=unclassified Tenacibaculum TaxID=2635139 RepID=UPI001F2F9F01|nr:MULTISPECIES: GyrI-like domain-containing protein [unclassified Tenacibaculum]MCF2874840.1 GyrI-like domain-containing protein [Tenacibaculum sp. Cn5-1]MCF2934094.1 GyrI-like domain-containing protein [Tenacibaculum sp. Cn5-34]MCG7510304.1 GyrI-like domain-containing protein [Tenacibaculum sp. Cn5-46]
METKEFYKNRLQQVVSYVRTQYNEKILIEELEELSNFSYRNLQRIFKAYYNETIGAYVTRLKIENGAKMLLFTKDEIKKIAENVGYSDVQSFSKSFKKHFGITPAIYRNRREEILKKNSNKTNTIMPFYEDRITVLETKKVVYKTYKGDYYSNKVDEIWDQLLEEVESYKVEIDELESFGIIWDEPFISESINYNYDACLVIDDTLKIPDKKFKVKNIPSKKYAVFTHIGDYKSISKTYDKIFSSWLFATDKEISEDPFLEFYTKHESHTENPKEYETEIYVPLKG